jgi:hypothetical protein
MPAGLIGYSMAEARECIGKDEARTPKHAADDPTCEMVTVEDDIYAIEVFSHSYGFPSLSAEQRRAVER